MFSIIILFQYAFFSIINCQNDKMAECQKLFDVGDDELIKSVLHPLAKSIEKFGFTKPEDYFKIFPIYQDAKENHKNALTSSRKKFKIFPSNDNIPDSHFTGMQKKNAKRGQIKKDFEVKIFFPNNTIINNINK